MKTAVPEFYRPNVGLMLIGAERRIFVGRRLNQPDAWQMPQGGVDKGETPVEAACRELREEVGTAKALLLRETRDWVTYDVPAELRPPYWKGRWRGQAQKWFALAFTGQRLRHRPRRARPGIRRLALGAGGRAARIDRALEAPGLRDRAERVRRPLLKLIIFLPAHRRGEVARRYFHTSCEGTLSATARKSSEEDEGPDHDVLAASSVGGAVGSTQAVWNDQRETEPSVTKS